jgi:hypothetical protein
MHAPTMAFRTDMVLNGLIKTAGARAGTDATHLAPPGINGS